MDNPTAAENLLPLNDDNPQPLLWDDPNKYARTAGIEIYDDFLRFHGYQEFILTRDSLSIVDDPALEKKLQLVAPYLDVHTLSHRSLLDLGANAGFFCFLAVENGADRAVAVDMDKQYLSMMRAATEKFHFQNIKVVDTNITEYYDVADVTLALALVHWIYSCTALYGNMDAVIQKLSQLTRYLLIVEWVDPGDPAVEFFHHLDWNKEYISNDYNIAAYESALARYFPRFKMIGEISATRKLYAAFKTAHQIDLSGEMPLLFSEDKVILRRCLTTFNGTEYWSCVYDAGDNIVKQASLGLARHEYEILNKLDSEYFPRVYDVSSADGYSRITMEKIRGSMLTGAIPAINLNAESFNNFAQHCLAILGELTRHGITHRDIRADNMMVRDGMPVLIDFGWAIAAGNDIFTPDGLGMDGRPPDYTFSDVYSMGLVLGQVNGHKYPLFDCVIAMMVDTDSSLRVTNIATLQALFLHVTEIIAEK